MQSPRTIRRVRRLQEHFGDAVVESGRSVLPLGRQERWSWQSLGLPRDTFTTFHDVCSVVASRGCYQPTLLNVAKLRSSVFASEAERPLSARLPSSTEQGEWWSIPVPRHCGASWPRPRLPHPVLVPRQAGAGPVAPCTLRNLHLAQEMMKFDPTGQR